MGLVLSGGFPFKPTTMASTNNESAIAQAKLENIFPLHKRIDNTRSARNTSSQGRDHTEKSSSRRPGEEGRFPMTQKGR